MLNTPNILSIFRLCLVPVFVVAYFSGLEHAGVYSVCVYIVATLTDFLDGYIARKYNMITNLGKVLDPLGDKMFTFAVLCCLMIDSKIPLWLVGLFFLKECLMGIGGLIIHRLAKTEIPPSNIIGKAATVIFFVFCCIIVVYDGLSPSTAALMVGIALAVSCIALISYSRSFIRIVKARDKDA